MPRIIRRDDKSLLFLCKKNFLFCKCRNAKIVLWVWKREIAINHSPVSAFGWEHPSPNYSVCKTIKRNETMATMISVKKSSKEKWGKEHNGAKLFVVSLYYSNAGSKWNVMGLTAQYHLNISLNAEDSEEANSQLEELKKDEDFHKSIKCYDLTIEELTKDTDYACTSVDISDDIKNVTMRYVASPFSYEETLKKERARVARLFAKKKWKAHED